MQSYGGGAAISTFNHTLGMTPSQIDSRTMHKSKSINFIIALQLKNPCQECSEIKISQVHQLSEQLAISRVPLSESVPLSHTARNIQAVVCRSTQSLQFQVESLSSQLHSLLLLPRSQKVRRTTTLLMCFGRFITKEDKERDSWSMDLPGRSSTVHQNLQWNKISRYCRILVTLTCMVQISPSLTMSRSITQSKVL